VRHYLLPTLTSTYRHLLACAYIKQDRKSTPANAISVILQMIAKRLANVASKAAIIFYGAGFGSNINRCIDSRPTMRHMNTMSPENLIPITFANNVDIYDPILMIFGIQN